jgi:hypothetical protein
MLGGMPDEIDVKRRTAANETDDLILRYIDSHSPEEISRMLGGWLTPARVRLRAQELVSASDWLTDAQQQKAALLKLRKWLAELEGRYMDTDNAKLRLSMHKTITERIDKRTATLDTDLNTYNVNVGREMTRVYDLTLAFMRGRLSMQIDAAEWDEIAKEALEFARDEVMKKAVEA